MALYEQKPLSGAVFMDTRPARRRGLYEQKPLSGAVFMSTRPARRRGLLHLQGLRAWLKAVLSASTFLVILTQGFLHVHSALIPAAMQLIQSLAIVLS